MNIAVSGLGFLNGHHSVHVCLLLVLFFLCNPDDIISRFSKISLSDLIYLIEIRIRKVSARAPSVGAQCNQV